MKRIGILGDIGSGKSFIAKSFGHPVFNADKEVARLYKKDIKIFKKLKKLFPEHILSFPTKKSEIIKAVLANRNNLKKIVYIVHLEIRKKMNLFLKINKNKKFVILDIPLLLENKINKKKDILVFVQSKRLDIEKRLKKRGSYNKKIIKNFKKIQLPLDYKKKVSHFIIENNFTKKSVKKDIKKILKKIK
ncbi:dephospho-CoA kinase [Candidatus Pelagibacter sp.]|nr:dephospho-CoA kinase [Candidatus Pelagibacter sp.]